MVMVRRQRYRFGDGELAALRQLVDLAHQLREIEKAMEKVEQEVAKVYDHITFGRVTDVSTEASVVITAADAAIDRILNRELARRGVA